MYTINLYIVYIHIDNHGQERAKTSQRNMPKGRRQERYKAMREVDR